MLTSCLGIQKKTTNEVKAESQLAFHEITKTSFWKHKNFRKAMYAEAIAWKAVRESIKGGTLASPLSAADNSQLYRYCSLQDLLKLLNGHKPSTATDDRSEEFLSQTDLCPELANALNKWIEARRNLIRTITEESQAILIANKQIGTVLMNMKSIIQKNNHAMAA